MVPGPLHLPTAAWGGHGAPMVPGHRHLSKVSKRCPARTVGHPKVIKGARHVPGPIRELTSLILKKNFL